jgi:2-methylisocitrate lyase-like PEP mutase family enzyme
MARNELARAFKALHIPSQPIIVPNVWDVASLKAIASLNTDDAHRPVKAVATSSWAVAGSLGIKDEELTSEQNLAAIQKLGSEADIHGIALSVDLGDGYGANIEEVVATAIKYGVVGANIEDSIPSAGYTGTIEEALYNLDEQVQRLKLALKAASDNGLPDFVLNARSDVFALTEHPSLSDEIRLAEAIKRGKAYLEAGATTVFFPTSPTQGLDASQVKALVRELDGRVTVKPSYSPDGLSTQELGQLGVARIQFGASFFLIASEATTRAATRVLDGGKIVE